MVENLESKYKARWNFKKITIKIQCRYSNWKHRHKKYSDVVFVESCVLWEIVPIVTIRNIIIYQTAKLNIGITGYIHTN